ncbi:hypothetical protein T11_12536 [Trichinella zimbabwensis]|uniref:Uncharacterized protein n=1 Tax=Trichinella zimbabwensis TaxID=268475 RepID=A0A0V1GVJ0_9BILA|nr:hypothetical protein T11_12536 [Trichinella zimbabwensis]
MWNKLADALSVQGRYFDFWESVEKKDSEVGLKRRYRIDEETKRRSKMLLDSTFLPVPQVRTGVCLLEAGTTGTLPALFQYFWLEWMPFESLPLWNVNYRVSSENATVGILTRENSDYTEKQEWIAQYSVECTSSSRTLELI